MSGKKAFTPETRDVKASERAENRPTKPKDLPPAAQRALAEAEARRRDVDKQGRTKVPEVGGRGGPDPVRYGDWEKGGIASDF